MEVLIKIITEGNSISSRLLKKKIEGLTKRGEWDKFMTGKMRRAHGLSNKLIHTLNSDS